jgi:hypothetical protein
MIRRKLISVLAVLPLIGGLCFAAYRFGPSSSRITERSAETTQPAVKQVATDPGQPASSNLFQLFGIYETAVAKGRVKIAPAEYLDTIEDIYRQRGYEKLIPEALSKSGLKSRFRRSTKKAAVKFFQRQEADGISTIFANGIDADYTTDRQDAQPYSFSTLVNATEDGGSEWATYRMEIHYDKVSQMAKLEDGDFPGIDPPLIPRPPGLRRIYASSSERGSMAIYESDASETSLMMRYLDDMSRHGWHVNSEITSNANRVAQGVMGFSRGGNLCLIWITKSSATGTTNVTISSH